jgi:hypothetical protein
MIAKLEGFPGLLAAGLEVDYVQLPLAYRAGERPTVSTDRRASC